MKRVILVDDLRLHDLPNLNAAEVMPDCDCACPIEGPAFPALDAPIYYALELTSACNNRCSGCSNVFERMRQPLPFTQWRDILDTIAPHTARLKITGGEPTLHPDFSRILADIEQRGILFTLFTNARWRDPQSTIDNLKATTTCTGVLISLHGATSATHEAFTGVAGSFAETIANIERATQAGLSVHISCVLMRSNLDQITDVVALAQNLGASATVFNRYIGPPREGISITPQQLIQAMQHIDALQRTGTPVHFGTCIPQCFTPSTSTGCLAGNAYCTLDPWGNLRPCNHVPWIAGNILTDSLANVWHSDVMQRWRALLPNSCTTCAAFAQCRGGCRAEAILNGVTRDPLMQAAISTAAPLESTQLRLYRHAKPTLDCEVHPQTFGYLLLRGGQAFPVAGEFSSVLTAIDTAMTLQEISNKYGQAALDWVGELYQNQYLMLSW